MKLKDYYQILGVSQDASTMDIKKAFRQMAMYCHPDRNPQDAEEAGKKFKEINEAYEVLGDGQTRRQYDSLVNLSRSGIVFTGFNRRGKWGCKRRQVWQCRRQQWQE